AADGAKGLLGAVHEIGPGSSVHVQIHEAGSQVAALQVHDLCGGVRGPAGAGSDGRDALAFHLDLAFAQHAVLKKDRSAVKDQLAHEEGIVWENDQWLAKLSTKAQRTQRAALPRCVLCTMRAGCTSRFRGAGGSPARAAAAGEPPAPRW